jgi:hypothetical protein
MFKMEQPRHSNGFYPCKIDDEAKMQITEMYIAISALHEDIKHLKAISETLDEIKTGLLNAILGKEIVPIGVTQTLLTDQRNSYLTIIKTLCWAFGTILVVLIGLKYLAPNIIGGL